MSDNKRRPSPALIPNPFVKKRNLQWTIDILSEKEPSPEDDGPSVAVVEAGTVLIDDHLSHFKSSLSSHIIPSPRPLLSIDSYSSLYETNAGSPHGAHFVIHQHDHPIAGTHYDLRLQINETSSASWAIMYGLPGDPNSVRLNRNATETRVHCLWNHLIETASSATGSLLIWDTGTYTILPRRSKHAPSDDPSSPAPSTAPSPVPSSATSPSPETPQSLLHTAFQNRKIRLRLHGSKLPDPYVLNLRLTKSEDAQGRTRGSRASKRRRTRRGAATKQRESSSGGEDDEDVVTGAEVVGEAEREAVSAMEREIRELEDEQVRRANAYPGASNTIASVHQRRWYLSLDRAACGFLERKHRGRSVWEPASEAAGRDGKPKEPQHLAAEESRRLSFPFYVRGVDRETSVVTGRRGEDILQDERVVNFTGRKGWNPVLN